MQRLNRDGVYALAARIIDDAIHIALHEPERNDRPMQRDVALTWAVMCGACPYAAARGIMERIQELGRAERAAKRRRRKARDHRTRYALGNECPVCSKLITNTAKACSKHRART